MEKKIQVGIIGAVSYTGRELIGLLLRHKFVELAWLTSESFKNEDYGKIYPKFNTYLPKSIRILKSFEDIKSSEVDMVFSCLPHGVSAENLKSFIDNGKTRIVDFSADFRIQNCEIYEKTYCVTHPIPDKIKKAVYGIPEIFKDNICRSNLVANPGCYPTSILLPLIPLLKAGCVDSNHIIADSKSGVSGAGKKPTETTHYVNCNESLAAYKIGNVHRHLPEIQEQLVLAGGSNTNVIFTPHLIPMERGILSTIYCTMTSGTDVDKVRSALQSSYKDQVFVNVVDSPPSTGDVKGTNNCHIFVQPVGEGPELIIVSVIDNLLKGASGQAVQNMNVMFGFPQITGLI